MRYVLTETNWHGRYVEKKNSGNKITIMSDLVKIKKGDDLEYIECQNGLVRLRHIKTDKFIDLRSGQVLDELVIKGKEDLIDSDISFHKLFNRQFIHIDDLNKLNTPRLLNYFKKIRSLFYRYDDRYDDKELMLKKFGRCRGTYINDIKSLLNSRGHVDA